MWVRPQDMQKLAYLLGVSGLLFLPTCTSNRQVLPPPVTSGSTHKTAPPTDRSDETTISTTLPLIEESSDRPDKTQRLVDYSRNLFVKGSELFSQGNLEEGRDLFRQSLESLKNSPFDFFLHPDMEKAYFDLLAEIQELEMQTLIDPSEMQLPSRNETPLEEIAELNLFTIEVDPSLERLVSQDLRETRFDIPVVLNQAVVRFLNYYRTRGRKSMEEGLRRSGKYMSIFQEIFRKEEVPLDLLYMAHVESLFKPRAYSRMRAKGIWQFIAGTGKAYGLRQDWWIDERSSITKSTEAAARYLKKLHAQFQDWNLAMASYNVGERRIERILRRYGSIDYWTMVKRRMLPRETRNFVPSILASILIYRHPERYGFYVQPEDPMEFDSVALGEQVDLTVAAEEIEVPLETLLELNPELRRGVTPFDYPEYQLKVPLGKGELLKARLASLPPEKRIRFRHHKVRLGETLSVIAEKYSSSIQAIAQVNRIRNIHRVRERQDLIIPLSGSSLSYSASRQTRVNRDLPANYIVRRGDSLARIARLYSVNVRNLLVWNNLRAEQIIYPGQRIRVLSKGGSPVEPDSISSNGSIEK